ncbi:hypothetical protein [Mesorhizobium sp. 128a]
MNFLSYLPGLNKDSAARLGLINSVEQEWIMPRALGVLGLEGCDGDAFPDDAEGAMINPLSYNLPVILRVVEGAWAEVVIAGDIQLEAACIRAARQLVADGAIALTANCGFFVRHQAAVAASVNVPVALSSLLLVPTLLKQLNPQKKLAVLTADSTHCTDDLFGLEKDSDRDRIVIGGIEGTKYWRDAMMRPCPPMDIPAIERDVFARLSRMRDENPEIAAVLCECTSFPLISKQLRAASGLPVFDITVLNKMMVAAALQ